MPAPNLWIVAGPNGAGKTTSVQKEPIARVMSGVTFLNPDDRTLVKLRVLGYHGFADAPAPVQLRCFIAAADEVAAELERALDGGQSVGVETVLSSDKYNPLVESVRARGGAVGLIYVALSSPVISAARIAARVAGGGHGVPEDKIAQRWQRSLDRLPWFAARATAFWVYDNSDSEVRQPRLLASGRFGRLEFQAAEVFPEMAAALAAVPR